MEDADGRMNLALQLTNAEQQQLRQLLEQLDAESQKLRSLNEMFALWSSFVAAVERGYNDSIYEYTNDLSIRDRLADLVAAAPPELSRKLRAALAPIDDRFMSATEAVERPLTKAKGDISVWWYRVPKLCVGELAEDLEELRYLN